MSVQDKLKETILKDYERRVKLYQEDTREYPIVCAGDSMFGFMHIKRYFGDLNIHNQGIPGDTTIGLLNRVDYIIQKNPEIVFIHIGSNDLVLLETSLDDIVQRILLIKNKLTQMIPTLKVYILTLTPVLSKHHVSNEAYIANRKNEDIIDINQKLKAVIPSHELIDVFPLLSTDDGKLNVNYTTDGIHLNDQGYIIYTQAIKKMIESR